MFLSTFYKVTHSIGASDFDQAFFCFVILRDDSFLSLNGANAPCHILLLSILSVRNDMVFELNSQHAVNLLV
jgi:hypothetical protein